MQLLLHITPQQDWTLAQQAGSYRADSLDTEGLIHCSTPNQVVKVANWFYRGQKGLVLLCIDGDRLHSPLRYDAIETGELFPHVYGPINLDAVFQVLDFPPGPTGEFGLPTKLSQEQSL
jgi:uncharacterized protein (DUF952 family)